MKTLIFVTSLMLALTVTPAFAQTLRCDARGLLVAKGSYAQVSRDGEDIMLFRSAANGFEKIPVLTVRAASTYQIARTTDGCESRANGSEHEFECRDVGAWSYVYTDFNFDGTSGSYYERAVGYTGEMPDFGFRLSHCH